MGQGIHRPQKVQGEEGGPASARNLRHASCWALLPVPKVASPGLQRSCSVEVESREIGHIKKQNQSQVHLGTEAALRPSDNCLLRYRNSPLLTSDMQNCKAFSPLFFCYDHYLKTPPAQGLDQSSVVVIYVSWTPAAWIQIPTLPLTH